MPARTPTDSEHLSAQGGWDRVRRRSQALAWLLSGSAR
jgi:hypothetical protein